MNLFKARIKNFAGLHNYFRPQICHIESLLTILIIYFSGLRSQILPRRRRTLSLINY